MTTTLTSPFVTKTPAEIGRARRCAQLARIAYPGVVGDQLGDDLTDWERGGWQFDVRGRGPALMAAIETAHNDMLLGRTYG
jgi:hypothetical protein